MSQKSQTLGYTLRIARELRKLSLREVEKASGISNAYISQLENNKIKRPSPHFLHKLAALYELDYEVLMEAAGYVKRRSKDGPKTLAGAVLCSQEKFTAEEEQQILEYLKFLRAKRE